MIKNKILEIISEEITHKDKHFDIKLKPIFQTIAENQYNLTQKFANNRTLETGIKKGLEPDSTPKYRKNSTLQNTLEIFVSKFYKEITNVVNMSVFKQIEYLRKTS